MLSFILFATHLSWSYCHFMSAVNKILNKPGNEDDWWINFMLTYVMKLYQLPWFWSLRWEEVTWLWKRLKRYIRESDFWLSLILSFFSVLTFPWRDTGNSQLPMFNPLSCVLQYNIVNFISSAVHNTLKQPVGFIHCAKVYAATWSVRILCSYTDLFILKQVCCKWVLQR